MFGQTEVNVEELIQDMMERRARLAQGIVPALSQGQALVALLLFNILLNKIIGATARGARYALGGAANIVLGKKKSKKRGGRRVR